MTGNLTINTASPILTFNAGAAGGVTIDSQKSGVSRWQMFLNDGVTETGANAGSNFRIRAIADAGGVIGEAITFNRATLSATFGGPVTVNGAATLAGNLTIAKDLPLITLQDSGTTGSWIVGKKSTGSARWEMALGDPGAGYNFSLTGYNDAGSGIEVLNIKRADGTITSPGPLILKSAGSSVAIGSIVQKIGFAGAEYGMALRPTVDNSYHIAFMNAAASQIGSIFTTPSATQFITSSDERLKEDLKSFDAGNIVDDTNVYDFAWRATGERSYGVIAQQAVEVYPAAVNYSEAQDAWGIDYSKYVPVILQELKALRARVAELEGKLDAKPS
jgi:hypothetical protein